MIDILITALLALVLTPLGFLAGAAGTVWTQIILPVRWSMALTAETQRALRDMARELRDVGASYPELGRLAEEARQMGMPQMGATLSKYQATPKQHIPSTIRKSYY